MKKMRFFGGLALATLTTGINLAACSSSSSSLSQPIAATDAGSDGFDVDTWNNYAQGFFATYCVLCHSATVPSPSMYPNQNFNTYADVKGLAPTIRCGVAPAGQFQSGCPGAPGVASGFPPPGQFPIKDSAGTNPIPDSTDRLRIIAWINAGAPEN
jgi:hypothetical protein